MTTALAAISSNRNTKVLVTPHRNMLMSNHTLNAFCRDFVTKMMFWVKRRVILMMMAQSTTTSAMHTWRARKKKKRGRGTFS